MGGVFITLKNKRERFFREIDDLIDLGNVDVIREVRSNPALRKRAYRLFPGDGFRSSTTQALEAYGFNFNINTITPSKIELCNCWEITEDFEVVINEDVFNELLACGNLEPSYLWRLLREVRDIIVLDSLSLFVSNTNPDMITHDRLRELPHWSFIKHKIGGVNNFRKVFGLDSRLALYDSPSKEWVYIYKGLKFEGMLNNFLPGIEHSQYIYRDCRPDFIIEGGWVDAKLSKGTALDSRDDTIRKYLKHTDHLTIIYAIDDGACTADIESQYNVTFKHVSEFYGEMHDDAISEIKSFIERVSIVKGISL